MAKRPRHRSTIATLRRLACENLYYDMARPRDDVIGELHLGRVGEAVTGAVAKRFGSNRRRAAHVHKGGPIAARPELPGRLGQEPTPSTAALGAAHQCATGCVPLELVRPPGARGGRAC